MGLPSPFCALFYDSKELLHTVKAVGIETDCIAIWLAVMLLSVQGRLCTEDHNNLKLGFILIWNEKGPCYTLCFKPHKCLST